MNTAICKYFVAPLMSEPSHRSEMETQILFGETVKVLEEHKQWLKVNSLYDGYEGWLLNSQIVPLENCDEQKNINVKWGGYIKKESSEILVPWGANIHDENNFEGEIKEMNKQNFSSSSIEKNAKQFLNTPYMWGGKTHAGIDCSGLTSVLYKLYNIPLKHDASWQAKQGSTIVLQNALAGDLAFFNDNDGDITHVGILLNNNTILHATETAGCVTIDDITENGIVSRISQKQTHQLHSIKRFINLLA